MSGSHHPGRISNKKKSAMPSPARAPHLASFVDSWVESGCLPGAIVGCWHREQETIVHVSGWANVATGDRLTRDHLFRIYSMTKPITACALMLLVEDGKVSLEDHVSKYLPAFAEARVCVGGTVDAPLTEPANRPSSRIARWLPTRRGADPQVVITVATRTAWPARSVAGATSAAGLPPRSSAASPP